MTSPTNRSSAGSERALQHCPNNITALGYLLLLFEEVKKKNTNSFENNVSSENSSMIVAEKKRTVNVVKLMVAIYLLALVEVVA